MRIVIAGGHGQIALHLERLLAEHGDQPVGLVRNADHADDLAAAGAETAVVDLESDTVETLADILAGADAAVFAAGAGPDSGVERKKTVDFGGAILLANACERAGVRRLIVISSIGTERADTMNDSDSNGEPNVMKVYLQAKAAADEFVRGSGLDWTVIRPGSLTDDPPTGKVTAAEHVDRAQIPRADVAAVVHAALRDDSTIGKQFEVVGGNTSVAEALAGL